MILLCSASFGYGQSILSAGDIAITGFNSDNPDQFTFVLLTDVLNTTQIRFTDNGWQNSGSFRANEGVIVWTATSDLPCGTEISVVDNSPYSVSTGTITDDNQFALAANGDQIIAYQGTDASPIFIYAIHFASATGWSDATNAQTSAVPSSLTDTVNAVYIGNFDNGSYDCSTTMNQSLILAAVSDATNWNGSNTVISIGGCSYICALCSSTATWVSGAWDNGTGPTSSIAAVIADNYNTSTVSAGITACSLTIDSGFTLTIDGGFTVEVENNVLNNGNISVLTDGSFLQNNDLGTFVNSVNDNSTVTKETAFLNAWYEYTYWSSPVVGEQIQDVFFLTNPDRRFWFNAENFKDAGYETNNNNILIINATSGGVDNVDDNANDWQYAAATDVLLPGVGYAATLSPIAYNPFPGSQFNHIFEGPFNNGVITVPVYRNDVELNDFNNNFIGNPYPSAIDFDLFMAENGYTTTNTSGTIDGAVYLWSHATPPTGTTNGNSGLNFGSSDYAVINGTMEIAGGDNDGDGVITIADRPNRFIPSGQGFFINYDNSGGVVSTFNNPAENNDLISQGAVTFRNSMRVSGNNDQFFKSSSPNTNMPIEDNKLWLLLSSDNGIGSQIGVGYVNGATNGDDSARFDTRRNASTGMSAFFYSNIENSDKKYSIQGKAKQSLTLDEVIPLGIYTTIDLPTIYSISISHYQGDFFNNNTIYLKDNLLNVTHDLSTNDYAFTSEVGDFTERFEVVFTNNTLNTDTFETISNSISIIELPNNDVKFTYKGNLTIKSVKILDVLGREIYYYRGNANTEIFNLSKLGSSVYIAKIELSNGKVISKKAIKK